MDEEESVGGRSLNMVCSEGDNEFMYEHIKQSRLRPGSTNLVN